MLSGLRTCLCIVLLSAFAFPQGIWERKAPFPISATEVSAAALDGKLYVVCGLQSGSASNRLFIYDPRLDVWSEGAPLPVPGGADHCNVAAVNGKLYVLGGLGISDGATFEYDSIANRWQQVATMPLARGASGVAAIGSRIYVAGGLAGGSSVANFDVFETSTKQWTSLPNMPTARDHLTAQVVNGKFYAIAGRAGREFNVNEEYDPGTNAWLARAQIPTARGGLGSGALNNRIQVFGGEGASGTPEGTFQQNEEYDPATNLWRALTPMRVPRHGLYGATLEGRIFAPSGGPRAGGNFSNEHDAFYLPPSEPPRISGVRHSASLDGTAALAPGTLVSLFGERFSFGEQVASRFPLASQMNAVVVKVDGMAVPLIYASPGQVNFLLPYSLDPRPISITVTNAGSESVAANATLAIDAPGIYTIDQSGQRQGAILIAGTGLLASDTREGFALTRPARRGEAIEIYATGLGAVTNPPPGGEAARSDPLSRTIQQVVVTIGGARAEVLFSGLTPGFTGLYQVNARVSQSAPVGDDVPVLLRMGETGPPSNTVTMAVE